MSDFSIKIDLIEIRRSFFTMNSSFCTFKAKQQILPKIFIRIPDKRQMIVKGRVQFTIHAHFARQIKYLIVDYAGHRGHYIWMGALTHRIKIVVYYILLAHIVIQIVERERQHSPEMIERERINAQNEYTHFHGILICQVDFFAALHKIIIIKSRIKNGYVQVGFEVRNGLLVF